MVVRIADKIVQAEVPRTLSPMDLDGKYMWAMSNIDIDTARDLGLTGIKKHWRFTSQIEKDVDGLHKDWILTLVAFVKHFWKTNDNKEVTENIKIR